MISRVKEGTYILAEEMMMFLDAFAKYKKMCPTFTKDSTKNNFRSIHNILYLKYAEILAMKKVLGFSEEDFFNFLLRRGYEYTLLWDEYKNSMGYMCTK